MTKLVTLGLITSVALTWGCSSSSSPTPPSSDENNSAQSSNQNGSVFYPQGGEVPAQGQQTCVGQNCQDQTGAIIGGTGVLGAMQVEYLYGENSVTISIKSDSSPTWKPINFQRGIQTIPDICNSDGSSLVDIQFQSDITYTDQDVKRVVGYKEGNSFYVGTDDEGDEPYGQQNYLDVNDEILKFTCVGNVSFSFRNLKLNPRIELNRWLQGDNEDKL